MQVQGCQKMPLGDLLKAIDDCRSINELFALVRHEGVDIRMKSQSSASNIAYKPLPNNPGVLPLDMLKKNVREAAIESARAHSGEHTQEQLIRAIETCPTIEKLFELVKNEHIVIQMKSFNSASNLPQMKPSEMQLIPDKSPLDRLKEQVIDAVSIPVLAAGGIFDGRGAAAMLMMGACGVQVGTRFLVADECHVHEVYKERLIAASDVSTMVTGKSLGDAVRGLKTPFTKKFARLEADPNVSDDEVRAFGTGSMRKAVFDGDLSGGSFLAGEVAGMIKGKETAAQIVDDIIGGAERLLAAAPSLLA